MILEKLDTLALLTADAAGAVLAFVAAGFAWSAERRAELPAEDPFRLSSPIALGSSRRRFQTPAEPLTPTEQWRRLVRETDGSARVDRAMQLHLAAAEAVTRTSALLDEIHDDLRTIGHPLPCQSP